MLRVVGRDACRSSRSLARRYYSIPTTSQSLSTTNPATPTPLTKKPRIDLRPPPIKPIPKFTPPSASHIKLHKHAQPSSEALTATPKLAEAKKEIQEHIHSAEVHGILTPPPPDANWFKRTLHTAIQLFVRPTHLFAGCHLNSFPLEILLPRRKAHLHPSKGSSPYQRAYCGWWKPPHTSRISAYPDSER